MMEKTTTESIIKYFHYHKGEVFEVDILHKRKFSDINYDSFRKLVSRISNRGEELTHLGFSLYYIGKANEMMLDDIVFNYFVQKIKVELNILNSLIGSKNIEEEFKSIVNQYPNVLVVVPILLAKREAEIKVQDADGSYVFNFVKMNYTVDQYTLFMRNSGLFDLLQNHIINNLVDYVLGIEVGMDTNGRKNRTGHVMEDLVESYLIKAGLVKGKTYFKEMCASDVEKKFHLDLSKLSNDGKAEKRFDFVFVGALGAVFACECNFYSGGGSKLNETARSYKTLTEESREITGFQFVWFTDGIGWNSAKHNLEETFDVLENLYNLHDLENEAINQLIDPTRYLNKLLTNK